MSAILIWALEHDVIDAALVSALEGDGTTWKAVPAVARTRDEVLATAGSRYTYSANTLAYAEAVEGGAERIALVGMSCQASVPAVMSARKAGKVARRLALSIGLLCSKTFDDAIFPELFEAKYGLERERHHEDQHQGRLPDLDRATAGTTRSRSRRATPGPARGARRAPTSPPSTPTSPPAASAPSATGPSPSCAPTRAARSWPAWWPTGSSRRGPATTTPGPSSCCTSWPG